MELLGYNAPRPKKEDYSALEKKIVPWLKAARIQGLSLTFFGSYLREDFLPGISDIDCILIFPDDVVINKKSLQKASIVLYNSLRRNSVPFQASAADLTTMKDGRFNTYNPTFKKYFKNERRVILGPDYIPECRFVMPKYPDQSELSYNLRKARNGLLFAEHDKREDYESFLYKFDKSLKAVSRGSKQLLSMVDQKLRINRFSALREIPGIFPEVDTGPLERIKFYYHNLDKLDKLYRNQDEVTKVWNSSVTFLEELIRAYINKFPNH
jgi:predicted nucleotidyltransferase